MLTQREFIERILNGENGLDLLPAYSASRTIAAMEQIQEELSKRIKLRLPGPAYIQPNFILGDYNPPPKPDSSLIYEASRMRKGRVGNWRVREDEILLKALIMKQNVYLEPRQNLELFTWQREFYLRTDPERMRLEAERINRLPDVLMEPIRPGAYEMCPVTVTATHKKSPAKKAGHSPGQSVKRPPRPVGKGGRKKSIKEAVADLPIGVLWSYFDLPGCPSTSCRSPFRRERNPSFSVYKNAEGKELFKDHGSPGVEGDSYDFYKLCTGLEGSEAYEGFVKLAADPTVMGSVKNGESCRTYEHESQDAWASSYFRKICQAAVGTLRADPVKLQEIANTRGWKPETIVSLMEEGSVGIQGGDFVYIYETGLKGRWGDGAERRFAWLYGRPSLWRRHRMSAAKKIYVCEGESDAISMVDAGVETDQSVAVVAVPSASTFSRGWVAGFAEKEVILCLDNDQAGQRATERIIAELKGVAATIQKLNFSKINQ